MRLYLTYSDAEMRANLDVCRNYRRFSMELAVHGITPAVHYSCSGISAICLRGRVDQNKPGTSPFSGSKGPRRRAEEFQLVASVRGAQPLQAVARCTGRLCRMTPLCCGAVFTASPPPDAESRSYTGRLGPECQVWADFLSNGTEGQNVYGA